MQNATLESRMPRKPLLRQRVQVSPASKEEFSRRIRSVAKAASHPKTSTTLGQVWNAFRSVLAHSLS